MTKGAPLGLLSPHAAALAWQPVEQPWSSWTLVWPAMAALPVCRCLWAPAGGRGMGGGGSVSHAVFCVPREARPSVFDASELRGDGRCISGLAGKKRGSSHLNMGAEAQKGGRCLHLSSRGPFH